MIVIIQTCIAGYCTRFLVRRSERKASSGHWIPSDILETVSTATLYWRSTVGAE